MKKTTLIYTRNIVTLSISFITLFTVFSLTVLRLNLRFFFAIFAFKMARGSATFSLSMLAFRFATFSIKSMVDVLTIRSRQLPLSLVHYYHFKTFKEFGVTILMLSPSSFSCLLIERSVPAQISGIFLPLRNTTLVAHIYVLHEFIQI